MFLHKLSLRQTGVTKNNEDFNTRPSKIVDTQKVRLKMIHVLLLINDSQILLKMIHSCYSKMIQSCSAKMSHGYYSKISHLCYSKMVHNCYSKMSHSSYLKMSTSFHSKAVVPTTSYTNFEINL